MKISVSVVAVVAACGTVAAQDSWYSVPLSSVGGMSRDGLVVVGRSGQFATTWTARSGAITLPQIPGETQSSANAASADGSIIAGAMTVNGEIQAFRYTAAGGKVALGPIPAGYTNPEATGMSADGSVIVGVVRDQSSPGLIKQGFVWKTSSGMTLFADPAYSTIELRAVSADGLVYMGNGKSAATGCTVTFLWSKGLGFAGPTQGCVPTNPSEYIVGEGLSDDGLALVGSWVPFRQNGFVWRAATGLQVIMGSAGNHAAYGVNNNATMVVGITASTLTASYAGIWTPTGVQQAQTYFSSRGINIPAGFTFQGSAVRRVSADGKAFVIENIAQPAQGFAYVGPCPANCDGSSGTPRLTANDFQCFLNKFAAGDGYANCDGSTGTPALTANDFQCFLNEYAAGCP